ncbi:dUTP diphosphatase [Candidatus Giovannonibacteria bacterium]|nr:dUTP diphosphatase [Candidatus Giovannonibacteria bacterium]
MKVRIRRIDKTLPLPQYKTAGAAAFDFVSRVTAEIQPKQVSYIPLNVAIEHPESHMIIMLARSSLHKKGLMLANNVGIFDTDFSGHDDEYNAAVYNFSDMPVTIEKGERISQGFLRKYERVEWEEVDDLGNKSRGGFGTTGLI